MNHLNTKRNKKHFLPAKQLLLFASGIFLLAVITGCKKFLDVQPQDKVPQTALFNDEQGFKDALTGVYLAMDKPLQSPTVFGLYTGDLTLGMMSTLAYDYDNATTANAGTNGAFFNNVVNYYYKDGEVKKETDGIWSSMYTNIANLNNLLVQIDSRKSMFTGDNFDRIKGEATARSAHVQATRCTQLLER